MIYPKRHHFGGYTTIVWGYTTIYWDTTNFWDIIWDIQPFFSSMKNLRINMILIQISGDNISFHYFPYRKPPIVGILTTQWMTFKKKVWWLKTIHCGIQQAAVVWLFHPGFFSAGGLMEFCTLAYEIKGYNRRKKRALISG